MDNGPGLRVVWADEGFELGVLQDRGFGWYSPDGVQWTAMAPNDHPTGNSGSSLPTGGFGSVVGVSDGFIATGAYPDGTCADPNGSCTGMWFSSDGLTWRLLGTTPELIGLSERSCVFETVATLLRENCCPGRVARSRSTATGLSPSGAPVAPRSFKSQRNGDGTVATGPLGIVSIGDGRVLVTRDGIDWDIQAMPAEMAADGSGRGATGVGVGERSVLVLVGGGEILVARHSGAVT